jgi:multimeric flavodoxin WrbA
MLGAEVGELFRYTVRDHRSAVRLMGGEMKVLCLLGSPREKGNSAAVANRFCAAAERLGAEVQAFALNKLEYRGCQDCMACKTKLDNCALEDDLSEVLDAVYETDVLVLASPVYYGDLSSQLKGFIDRSYSYLASDYLTNPKSTRLPGGKKLVFILIQGNPDQESITAGETVGQNRR